MARSVLRSLGLALVLSAAITAPALGHVHNVSNAECAPAGVLSGALQSADAPGRPAAQIPITASGDRTQGRANDANAQGVNC